MKKIIYSFNVLVAGIVMCFSTANAATYTAAASGNWTDAATWGGTAPGSTLTLDNVIIPAGITVTLNTDVDFDGGLLFSVQVNGELSSSDGSEFMMSSGSLTGNGTIDISSFSVSGLTTIAYTGDMMVDEFRNDVALTLNLSSHLTVSDSLILQGGALTFGNGSTLVLSTDAVVRVDGGTVALNGGIVTGTNTYHVLYTGTSAISGIETTWAGMTNMTVDLNDDNQALSLGTDAVINGEVKQMNGWIDLNGNDLTLNGNYNNTSDAGFRGDAASSLMINSTADLTSELWFEDGTEDLDNLHLNTGDAMSTELMSDLHIHGDLVLEDGELKIMGGSSLYMENGSNVMVDGGSLMTSNGVFNGDNNYNVMYMGSATETGVEMTGSGMQDLTLDLDDEAGMVAMIQDYTVHGDLNLTNGNLDMNGNDLTLMGGVSTEETGWLMGDANSNLNVNGATSWDDTLFFADNGNMLDKLNLNLTGGSHMMLGSDLSVNDINLTSGSILIYDNMLTINTGGSIAGSDEDKYIMIDGDGQLKIEMTSGSAYVTFPVGTMDGYSPAMVKYNTGATSSFMVGVEEGVYAVGTYGDDLSETESIVDRTWTVNSTAGATSDIDMKVSWSQAMEVNGFDRTDSRISGFTNGNWDYSDMGSAVTNSNGMYEMTREDVTNMGRFAVTDANSALEIPQNDALISGVYPNPASEILNVSVGGATQIQLIDAYGKVVSTASSTETAVVALNLTSLPAGMYYVRANANGAYTTQKVIKN